MLMLCRNNNSSRFGKYFEIFFDRLGRPQGGKIECVGGISPISLTFLHCILLLQFSLLFSPTCKL